MRFAIACVAAIASLAVTTASAGAAADAAVIAHLAVLGSHPLTVRGTGFGRHERVRVRVRAPGAHLGRRVRAGRRGRFTTRFDATIDRCTLMLITAVGADGSRAVVRRPPQPGCAPA